MKNTTKRTIAVLACIAIMLIIAMPISADYIKDYGNMRYAIGTSGITITANGASNYDYYSEEFSGGGMVSNSTYFPTIAQRTETDNYLVLSEPLDESNVFVTKEYNNNSWGYVRVPHEVRAKKNLNALTFNGTYIIEGKYSDIFNDVVGINYFAPYSSYRDASGRATTRLSTTVQMTVNCIDTNGAKVQLSHTENQVAYGLNGGAVHNLVTTTACVTAIETKLEEYAEQANASYMTNQRCRVVFTTTDVVTNYDMNNSLPQESRVEWNVQYPVTSTNGVYTPTSATIPYNVIDNKVDMDVDFTQWIGTAISGIWSFELLPNISIGAILIAILSTCIVIAFLKFFAGG